MRKFKLDKNISTRISALVMAGTLFVTGLMAGCSKKEETNTVEDTAIVTIQNNVDVTEKGIISLFPTMNKDVVENAALIIRLEEIAKEDENGKINADVISKFKSKIDTDNMMSDFNSFTDELEETMIQGKSLITVSNIVISKDKEILSKIEKITGNIITGDENAKKSNFDLIYTLFVEEDEITYDGLTFSVRDLSYAGRALSQVYARTSANYAKELITEEKYAKVDDRTNDQNNKAYIKTDLEILSNNMTEKSEIDVVNVFNKKYDEIKKVLSGKINTSDKAVKNLVNYVNLEYLNSDKVSNKDKNTILGEYEEKDVTDVLLLIDTITEYNKNNTGAMIPMSMLLVDAYTKTETGKVDKVVLDYIQFNSIYLLKETNENTSSKEIFNNGYFQNIYKYMRKDNFTHKYKDGSVDVAYHNISGGTKFIANDIVYYTLNKRTNVFEYVGYEEKINMNLEESIQYLQNAITGECEKAEIVEFIKK